MSSHLYMVNLYVLVFRRKRTWGHPFSETVLRPKT